MYMWPLYNSWPVSVISWICTVRTQTVWHSESPWKFFFKLFLKKVRAWGSAVVECLTRDRTSAGSSLISVTTLCPWARHINPTVRTGTQWTTLFCVYFVMLGLIAQWPSKFNASIHRLIGDIFFVTKCIAKWAVIWWNLLSFEHLHFFIYPKCTFVRITSFSLLSMNNYTVL